MHKFDGILFPSFILSLYILESVFLPPFYDFQPLELNWIFIEEQDPMIQE